MKQFYLPNTTETQYVKTNGGSVSLSKFFGELQNLVTLLGHEGGKLSPSIYDTAQVLRFAPPDEGVEPALEWLLKHQESDGGWGNPLAPFMRDVPTLVTILALHQYNSQGRFNDAIQCGLEFLKRQNEQWEDFSVEDLLVGVELILPKLVEEAVQNKLNISIQPYLKLSQLGAEKRKLIQNLKVIRGTPAAFSWESWGEVPHQTLLDPIYSVGNSPSATAVWISKAQTLGNHSHISDSRNYLRLASGATGLEIPGVVPFAWPIDRFEQSFAQYALAIGGLLTHPSLEAAVTKQVDNLFKALTPYGMPFTDYFIPDLDDTAASIVVFRTLAKEVRGEVLRVFKHHSGYFTYPGEFHASTTAHARAVHALGLLEKEEGIQAQAVLLRFQNANGIWPGDKWHKSWLYSTSHMLYALHTSPHLTAVERGLAKLVEAQKEDGGWGMGRYSTTAETAYVMLALHFYKKQNPFIEQGYQRAKKWLLHNIYRQPTPHENLWIGKELFKPYRIDRAFELTALLQAFL
ncbi:MAG: hypothetical protein HUU38_28765 [Anaerolineales bacterium]|nr:hypothetical protein [Anaerolineales bacterium]